MPPLLGNAGVFTMTSVELSNLEVAANDQGLEDAPPLSESFLLAQSQGSDPVPVDAGAGQAALPDEPPIDMGAALARMSPILQRMRRVMAPPIE